MSTCPKCGGKVLDNRCTECGFLIPEEYKEGEKKVFMTMPNLKDPSVVVNKQFAVSEFADGSKPKKTVRDYLKQAGKYVLQAILMVAGILLLGTIFQYGSGVLEFLFSWTQYL